MTQQRIVAEISRSWEGGDDLESCIGERFEGVITTNIARGYTLESWRFQQTFCESDDRPSHLVETIVAVFIEDAGDDASR